MEKDLIALFLLAFTTIPVWAGLAVGLILRYKNNH